MTESEIKQKFGAVCAKFFINDIAPRFDKDNFPDPKVAASLVLLKTFGAITHREARLALDKLKKQYE